jgi:hypothetical protein
MVGAYCVGIMKSKMVSLLLSFFKNYFTNKFALTNNIAKIYLHGMELPVTWFGASYLKEQVLF